MTIKIVTDELYGKVSKRMHELMARMAKGVIDPHATLTALQYLIEGREVTPFDFDDVSESVWITRIVERERQYHRDFFGQEFDLREFKNKLQIYGRKRIKKFRHLGLEIHFLPDICMHRDARFPGWKIRPDEEFYDHFQNIYRKSDHYGERGYVLDVNISNLNGETVLIDMRKKSDRKDVVVGKSDNDELLDAIIGSARMQTERKMGKSRFGINRDEWNDYIFMRLASRMNLSLAQIRLERMIEFNVIAQLYPHMPRKNDDVVGGPVWLEEFKLNKLDNKFYPIAGGGCPDSDGDERGGLKRFSEVHFNWEYIQARPIVVL